MHAGIGINHIHTVQEIARLKDILQHTYINSTNGLLYRTSLEYLILEIGMGTNLTQIDFNKYQHLATNCLLKSTWEFIYTHKITLEHDITVPKNAPVANFLQSRSYYRGNRSTKSMQDLSESLPYIEPGYSLM
jgi:hypothetical protein